MSTSKRSIIPNIWISLSAASITAYFSIAFGAVYDLSLFWLILSSFLSTFAIYTFYRQSNQLLLWMIPAAFAIFISFTSYVLNFIIGINLILCLLYQSPFSKFPLRKNPWIKPLLISACWLNSIWLAPLLQYAVPVWESMAVNFSTSNGGFVRGEAHFLTSQWKAAAANGVAIFCMYYALCLLTDLIQVKEDQKNGFISFPVKFGIKTTLYSALLLMTPILCFSFIHFPYSLFMLDGIAALTWALGGMIVAVWVYKKPNHRLSAFWVDNIIGACALTFLLLHLVKEL
jgi:4-hydroxybenzoate polyprenyltransferase